jgi:hypothetical protein
MNNPFVPFDDDDDEALQADSANVWAAAATGVFLATIGVWGYSWLAISASSSRPSPGTFGPILQPLVWMAGAAVSVLGGVVEMILLIIIFSRWRRRRLDANTALTACLLAAVLLAIALAEIGFMAFGPDL